jgi:hypothetical protein
MHTQSEMGLMRDIQYLRENYVYRAGAGIGWKKIKRRSERPNYQGVFEPFDY